MKYEFITNCISAEAEDIDAMVEESSEISLQEFVSKSGIDISELNEFFNQTGCMSIKNEPCISFYESKYKGQYCLYIVFSGIEYIFG